MPSNAKLPDLVSVCGIKFQNGHKRGIASCTAAIVYGISLGPEPIALLAVGPEISEYM